MACTSDPLNGEDRDEQRNLVFHLIPIFRSDDLVTWEYLGDAFDRDPATPTPPPPAWVDPTAVLWAPELARIGDQYILLFAATDVTERVSGEPGCDEDSAIGYATGASPLGPWQSAPTPLVAPQRADEGCEFYWTLDPEVVESLDRRHHLFFGSFYGGIRARDLVVTEDGILSAPEETTVLVTIPNRYEGAEVVRHDGQYFLFASATNCCAGPQTGYAVFVARSDSPTGPFLDREDVLVLDPLVGGTPFLVHNGNGWIGPGHNTLVQDRAGQWWTIYHAVEERDPFFAGAPGFTQRPALLDRVDWVEGWPVVNGGAGPSSSLQPAPAVVADSNSGPDPLAVLPTEALGAEMSFFIDEFDGSGLASGWNWVRGPLEHALEGGALRLPTQAGDLHEDSDNAPVLVRDAPDGDFVVETRVRLDVPDSGCCYNYVQAGLVLRQDDNNYLKLVVVSIWETRQTEFARETLPVLEGSPRYGNTVVGPPGLDWTWLRLAVRRQGSNILVTAFTSRDGTSWSRGGAWSHELGQDVQIGLVAMGGSGFTAEFGHLRVAETGLGEVDADN